MTALFCSEIEPKLYLGSIDAASDENILQSLNITHILTVDYQPLPASTAPEFSYKYLFIRADDRTDEDLISHFPKTFEFINEVQSKNYGNCLVHCFGGVSRSATLVIAFLMQKYKINFTEAHRLVKKKRDCICPNYGFIVQLRLFELMNYKLQENFLSYRLLQMEQMSRCIKNRVDPVALQRYLSTMLEERKHLREDLRCRKCRKSLINSNSYVLSHHPGQDLKWHDLSLLALNEVTKCQKGMFIDVPPWAGEYDSEPQGKILCPGCKSKLGSYCWKGLSCSCGAKIVPGFSITLSKVDRNLPQSESSQSLTKAVESLFKRIGT